MHFVAYTHSASEYILIIQIIQHVCQKFSEILKLDVYFSNIIELMLTIFISRLSKFNLFMQYLPESLCPLVCYSSLPVIVVLLFSELDYQLLCVNQFSVFSSIFTIFTFGNNWKEREKKKDVKGIQLVTIKNFRQKKRFRSCDNRFLKNKRQSGDKKPAMDFTITLEFD